MAIQSVPANHGTDQEKSQWPRSRINEKSSGIFLKQKASRSRFDILGELDENGMNQAGEELGDWNQNSYYGEDLGARVSTKVEAMKEGKYKETKGRGGGGG